MAPAAPRGHKQAVNGAAGAFLMERLIDAVGRTGVRLGFDVVVERLVLEGDEVVGVVARRHGTEIVARARSGVVLCAGGFVNNPDFGRMAGRTAAGRRD